jgi:hypothetical protein
MTVCHYSGVQYQTADHLWYKETQAKNNLKELSSVEILLDKGNT